MHLGEALWDGEALVQVGWSSTEFTLVEFSRMTAAMMIHGQCGPIVEVAVGKEVVGNAFLTLCFNGFWVLLGDEQ